MPRLKGKHCDQVNIPCHAGPVPIPVSVFVTKLKFSVQNGSILVLYELVGCFLSLTQYQVQALQATSMQITPLPAQLGSVMARPCLLQCCPAELPPTYSLYPRLETESALHLISENLLGSFRQILQLFHHSAGPCETTCSKPGPVFPG